MPRTPTLYLIPSNKPLAEMYTEADRAYCAALNFIQEKLAFTVEVANPNPMPSSGAATVMVKATKFTDPKPGSLRDLFLFLSPDDWSGWYKGKSFASTMAASTEALTYWPDRKIGVQIGYHTFGTLVHESFHFLSHQLFRSSVNSLQNEGCTELLTRVVLGIKKGQPRADVRGRGNFYGPELENVSKWINTDVPDDTARLLRAYALGDPSEIKVFQALFKL